MSRQKISMSEQRCWGYQNDTCLTHFYGIYQNGLPSKDLQIKYLFVGKLPIFEQRLISSYTLVLVVVCCCFSKTFMAFLHSTVVGANPSKFCFLYSVIASSINLYKWSLVCLASCEFKYFLFFESAD